MKFTISIHHLVSALLIASSSFVPVRAQDPDCTRLSAAIWSSDADAAATAALSGDGDYWGIIYRNRFDGLVPCEETNIQDLCTKWEDFDHDVCNDAGDCGVAASYWHQDIKTPNQAYPSGEGGAGFAANFKNATVGYAAWDSWSMNGGPLRGFAYYPTDSNSNDGRDWLGMGTGLPGQGCHGAQNFQCTSDGCLALEGVDNMSCKCNYLDFPDLSQRGELLTRSFEDSVGFRSCLNEEENDDGSCISYGPANGIQNTQSSYQGHDYSSCWVEESDFVNMTDMSLIIKAQNSIYQSRWDWWNKISPAWEETPYWGWNEVVSFTKELDDMCGDECNQDALVVVLPSDDNSICDLDKDTAQYIETQLMNYWKDSFGKLPVIVAKSTSSDGGENYEMEFFTQNFTFENGNCIIPDITGDTNNAYFYPGCSL